ncbi:MAG: site-2 protease family protein [Pseudomonadales bacterium]|nr:site-2 protease family protein [Pseudomonadales bacterium]
MKWNWKIARIAEIDVYIHLTFLLLVAWFGFHSWQQYGTLAGTLQGMAFIVALFTCVVLHEFGHALTARRYNIVTRSITLLPIGGVATMEKMPEDPLQEVKVALAGPAVNIVIAFILWLWLSANNVVVTEADLLNNGGPPLYRLMLINVVLAVFNLIPAFPMDGGRVLRAVLAMRMKHHEATDKAASIGQMFALWFGLLGLFYNPILLLIAVFLWFGAAAENQSEQIKVSLGKATAADAMLTEFHILAPEDSLTKAIQLTLAGSQKDFPVGTHQHLTGLLTQNDLLVALQEKGQHTAVSALHLQAIQTVDYNLPIEQLLTRIEANGNTTLAVRKGSNIVGIINLDNILELIKIQNALHKRRSM